MFDNISSLKFQEGNNKETLATAMISAEGEAMDFRQSVAAEGRVEDWMTGVLEEMRKTNRLITKEAIFKYCQDISRYGPKIITLYICQCYSGVSQVSVKTCHNNK